MYRCVVVGSLISLLFCFDVLACSCKRLTLEEQVSNASWVFTASINKLELIEETDELGGRQIAVGFDVSEPLKGDVLTLSQLKTGTGTCGMDFEILRDYLILVNSQGSTNICKGTMQVLPVRDYTYRPQAKLFLENITAFINGVAETIPDYEDPIKRRTINGHELPIKATYKTGCKKIGTNSEQ